MQRKERNIIYIDICISFSTLDLLPANPHYNSHSLPLSHTYIFSGKRAIARPAAYNWCPTRKRRTAYGGTISFPHFTHSHSYLLSLSLLLSHSALFCASFYQLLIFLQFFDLQLNFNATTADEEEKRQATRWRWTACKVVIKMPQKAKKVWFMVCKMAVACFQHAISRAANSDL